MSAITHTVDFTRGPLLFTSTNEDGDVAVFTVDASIGDARGMVWVEATGYEPEIIKSSDFRERYPLHERRTHDATTSIVANVLTEFDRRAA